MLAEAIARAASSGGIQIGNNPTTYLGTTGVVAVMGFLYRLVSKIIDRGDKRDDRQWSQVETDLTRRDDEIIELKRERDDYRDRWLDCANQGRARP